MNLKYTGCVGKCNPNVNAACECHTTVTQAYNDPRRKVIIPAEPCINSEIFDVRCVPGGVGIALNGVEIYSVWGSDPCFDAILAEGGTFDECGGHSDPAGHYHYHVAPHCLLNQMNDYDTPNINGHSPQIGWAYDGFPIYGPHGVDGELIYPLYHPNANEADSLDGCNGHGMNDTYGHEIDGFRYHYHMTGPIADLSGNNNQWMPISSDDLPDTNMWPYSIGCLRGYPLKSDVLVRSIANNWDIEKDCELRGLMDSYDAENSMKDGVVTPFVFSAAKAPGKNKYDGYNDNMHGNTLDNNHYSFTLTKMQFVMFITSLVLVICVSSFILCFNVYQIKKN